MADTPPEELDRATDGLSVNANGRQLRRNVLSSYGAFLLQLLLGLVLAPALLRGLGQGGFGTLTVVTALASYVGIAELGLGTATVRAVAAATAGNNDDELNVLASTSLLLYLAVAGTGSLVLVGMVVALPNLGVHEGLAPARAALLLLGGAQALALMLNVFPALLYGTGRSSGLTNIGSVAAVLGGVLQIAASLGTGSLILVATAGASLTGVSALLIGVAARRQLPGVRLSVAAARQEVAGQLLRSGWRNAVIGVSAALAFNTDALIVGGFLGAPAVAAYGVAARAASLVGGLSSRLSDVLVPTFAHFAVLNDRDRVYALYRDSVQAGLLLAIPGGILALTTGPALLHLWLGSVPTGSDKVLYLLVCSAVLAVPGAAAFRLLSGMSRLRFVTAAAAVAAAVNLLIGLVSTPLVGVVGPAVGTLVTAFGYDVLVMPTHACHELGFPVSRLLRDIRFLAVPAVVGFGAGAVAQTLGDTPFGVLARCALVGVVYAAVVLATMGAHRRRRFSGALLGRVQESTA